MSRLDISQRAVACSFGSQNPPLADFLLRGLTGKKWDAYTCTAYAGGVAFVVSFFPIR